MKKKWIISIAIVSFLISVTIVSANIDLRSKIEEKMLNNTISKHTEKFEIEFKKVKTELEKVKNKELEDVVMGEAIKVYYLNEPDIVKSYYKEGSLNKLISDEYLWNIIVKDSTGHVNTVKMKENKEKGDFNLVGYSTNDTISIDTILSQKNLQKLISKSDIKDISDLKYIMVPMYHINLLFVNSDKDEYVIAFDSRPDLTGLERNRVYEVKKLISILDENFDY